MDFDRWYIVQSKISNNLEVAKRCSVTINGDDNVVMFLSSNSMDYADYHDFIADYDIISEVNVINVE